VNGWKEKKIEETSLHARDHGFSRAPTKHRLEIVVFLRRKWAKELDYRLIKELWAFAGNRIAVRFAYEWHDDSGNWFR
jgi:nuclear transport factor 2 (NTF2) superfamily protein